MNFEVGMYARTKDGYVVKITRHEHFWINNEEWDYITTDIGRDFDIDKISKASYNIIDLIEVGDYVNGYPIYEILEYKDNTRAIVIADDNKSIIWQESSQDIKSIVTKEQFESMSYKL